MTESPRSVLTAATVATAPVALPAEAVPTPARTPRRPARHLPPPSGWRQRVHRARFTLARRLVQFSVLALFIGTLHAGWTLAGAPLLAGNLSASSLAGVLPMADPFAVLQMLLARQPLATEVLVGALVVLLLYGVLSGRVFCAWVCPMNLVTDAAATTRRALGLDAGVGRGHDLLRIPATTRYAVLALALAVSAGLGAAAFEWVSPVAMLHRELIYGAGLGLAGALGIFLLDTFVLHRGWCGHL
jgi:ferredoxin-type protein NapH